MIEADDHTLDKSRRVLLITYHTLKKL